MEDDMDDWMYSDSLLDDLPEDLWDPEEFGTPKPGFIQRLVERPARGHHPVKPLHSPSSIPTSYTPLPEVPMSKYEEMRAKNIRQQQEMFNYINGDQGITNKEQANM